MDKSLIDNRWKHEAADARQTHLYMFWRRETTAANRLGLTASRRKTPALAAPIPALLGGSTVPPDDQPEIPVPIPIVEPGPEPFPTDPVPPVPPRPTVTPESEPVPNISPL